MKRLPLLAMPLLLAAAPTPTLDESLNTLRKAGPEAATAWKVVSSAEPAQLPLVLAALDDASPVASNLIRSAADAIAEKHAKQLPVPALQAFLADTRHAAPARRQAFELIRQADPALAAKLLPTFETDPAPELRYEAIDTALAAVKSLPKDDANAKKTLHRLLDNSRDFEQSELVAKALGERGDTIDLTTHFGFIPRWQLLAPLAGPRFADSLPPEKAVVLDQTVAGKDGKPVKWQEHTTKEKYAAVDLNKAIGVHKDAVAYAFTAFTSDKEQPVEIRAASSTALKLFLNGQEVFAREAYHQSFSPDTYIAPVTLLKGRNTLLMKVCQNNGKQPWEQNWMFQVRLTDPTGVALHLPPAPFTEDAK